MASRKTESEDVRFTALIETTAINAAGPPTPTPLRSRLLNRLLDDGFDLLMGHVAASNSTLTTDALEPSISGRWLAALDDFRNWLIREAA